MPDRHYELNDLNTPLIDEFCDSIPGGYFVYKAEGNEELIYASQAVFDIFGCKDEEEFKALTGYTFRGMVYPHDYFEVSESIIRQIKSNPKHYNHVEYRIIKKDGTVRWVNDYGHYVETEEYGGLYYVFISDITKKLEDRDRENKIRETVISTLTRFYNSVWVIDDVETEQWSLYYADNSDNTIRLNSIKKQLNKGRYSEDRVYLLENMVAPIDRERVRDVLSLKNIVEQLKERDQFSITFLRQYKDGMAPKYFRIDVGKLEMPDNRMGVTLGFKDVDTEFRAVQNAEHAMHEINEAKEENKRLNKQIETAKGVAALVDSVTSLLSNIPAMTFSKRADTGVYTACNQAFADYAHLPSPEDVVGKTDYELFDEETARHFVEDDQTALSMDKPYIYFEDVRTGDGSEIRNLQTTKIRFVGSNGTLGLMALCIDINEITKMKAAETRSRELEQRIALQEKLLEETARREEQDKMINALASNYRRVYHVDLDSDDAVCYRSETEIYNDFPEGAHFPYYQSFSDYALLYIDKAYVNGFLEFIDPENIRENLSHDKTINYRYLIRRNDKEYYEMISVAKVGGTEEWEETEIHYVGIGLTDVDEEMRDSIAKNEALAQALSVAEEANSAKTSFLSNMSHEIRTPMNAIIGLDSLALMDENLSSQTREYLERIKDSADHLMRLINDILDMSRIESGKLVIHKEEFSFRNMLEQINTMVMAQCAEKGLKYECKIIGSVSDHYIGDDMKLKQVLINTLSNAVKFTEAPGNITLTIERLNVFQDQSTLKFIVKDTGIGISEEFIPKIFDSFSQENGGVRNKYGSTGLGMAITKNIVELMNGTISVESEKGVGSEFTVVVTLKNAEIVESVAGSVKPGDLRVLIIDSDEGVAEHMRLVLDEMGIFADTSGSGREALRMLRVQQLQHNPYNLVLMDWMSRGLDVLDITKKIRKQYNSDTTMIFISSYKWDETIMNAAKKIGVDSFISKPLRAEGVLNEFERIARKNNIGMIKKKHRVELEGKRILLAEDIFVNAEIIRQLMLVKGAMIDHAENGKLALEMFSDSAPGYYDAVLMDIRMPVMDGLEAAEAIRALNRADAKRVPIIAMTANAFDEDVQRSLQAGMNAHLSKPIEPHHLYLTLEEMIWEAEQG